MSKKINVEAHNELMKLIEKVSQLKPAETKSLIKLLTNYHINCNISSYVMEVLGKDTITKDHIIYKWLDNSFENKKLLIRNYINVCCKVLRNDLYINFDSFEQLHRMALIISNKCVVLNDNNFNLHHCDKIVETVKNYLKMNKYKLSIIATRRLIFNELGIIVGEKFINDNCSFIRTTNIDYQLAVINVKK